MSQANATTRMVRGRDFGPLGGGRRSDLPPFEHRVSLGAKSDVVNDGRLAVEGDADSPGVRTNRSMTPASKSTRSGMWARTKRRAPYGDVR
jgi:hypothetical protein